MQTVIPKANRIVFVGGGHTHALILRSLAMAPLAKSLITLINPSTKAPYTGMLPGHVAGLYTQDEVEIDLLRLARAANAQIVLDEVTAVDPNSRTISLKNRPSISYDLTSINIGVTSDLPMISGFQKYGHAAKPLGLFAHGWNDYLKKIAATKEHTNIAVIGGGVAGIELALAMAFRLKSETGSEPNITIIERDSEILKGTFPKTKNRLLNHLQNANISILTNAEIIKVTKTKVYLSDGSQMDSHFTVGAAGATPHPWISEIGLETKNGFICIDETLTTSDPNIFAAGDCAHFSPKPLPKAGVFAVRQAPILLQNLRAASSGKPKRIYKPQRTYLKLISTGSKNAVADKFGITLDGRFMWNLKDRIDRKFMDQLNAPPSMNVTFPNTATKSELDQKYQMMCGGCGAKMESRHLSSVLSQLPMKNREDVISSSGDDAAVLKHGDGFQVFTTDQLRAFSNDPWLMGEVAAIHALGDIWSMGAAPQAALASIILPPMADHLHAAMLDEILTAATNVLRTAGADLVGGHTSIGTELTVGFSITGLRDLAPIQNANAQAGDALILTKPLGIGTILAAEMRAQADGRDVEEAYNLMRQSSQISSQILSPHARAMTDVTGFGLAGHLNQMMENSDSRAMLIADQIPVLGPAITYANAGIRSSLWTSNRNAIPNWTHSDTGRNALLFDPQTAGGLLAAVPSERAETILMELKQADIDAHIIGHVVEGPAGIDLA